MHNPARGLSSWGAGLWLGGGLPKFITGVGSQVFPALHYTVTVCQVLQDRSIGKLSFPASGPPCCLAQTTATAPVTVSPGSLVRSAQTTRSQRIRESKRVKEGQLLRFIQSEGLLRGGSI